MKRFTLLWFSVVLGLCASAVIASTAMAAEGGPLLLTVSGGAGHIITEAGTDTFSSSEGELEMHSTVGDQIKGLALNNVDIPGLELKCTSSGEPSGTVRTERLNAVTGWINKEKDEAGIDLQPVSGGGSTVARMACEGINMTWRGSVIGYITPVNASVFGGVHLTLKANVTTGHQEPEKFEGGLKDVLASENCTTTCGPENEIALTEEINLNKEKGLMEFNTVANPLQPEFGRCQKVARTEVSHFEDANCTKAKVSKSLYNWDPAS